MYGVEFYSGILIPGMVNAHTHLELSYLKGHIPSGGGFTRFADGLTAVRGAFTREDMQRVADYRDTRMYAEGVSAVGDISNGNAAFDVKQRSAIRYHTFLESFGLDADIGSMKPLYERAVSRGLSASITPHSTYSLNDAAFRDAVGDVENSPLSVHFMESREEEELFSERGGMWEWYARRGLTTDFTRLYGSPAERIIRCIPSGRRILLIHNTFITPREVGALTRHFGDGVTFVVCPRSNRYINDADPPVGMLLDMGVRVAVGTDSLASNTSLSMIEELKSMRGIPLETLLTWATLSGAQALGIDAVYGSLEPGKKPGIALVEGVDWQRMELLPSASTRRIV